MKLSLTSSKGAGLLISRVSAAWTAADKPHGWVYGVPGKQYPCYKSELLNIRVTRK